MNKFSKAILIAFTAVLVLAVLFVPKARQTQCFDEKTQSVVRQSTMSKKAEMLRYLNIGLPRKIGTLGWLNSIDIQDTNAVYKMTINGDPSIIDFYKENYVDFQEMVKYSLLMMNGEDYFEQTLDILKASGIHGGVKLIIAAADNREVSWHIGLDELRQYKELHETNSSEAINSIINLHVKLGTIQLPQEFGNGLTFINILREGNKIIYKYKATEDFDFDWSIPSDDYNTPEIQDAIANSLSEDPDIKEAFSLYYIARTNMVYRLIRAKNEQCIDIYLPYTILYKYSSFYEFYKKYYPSEIKHY